MVAAIEAGYRRIVLASPTGTGKSAMMCALIQYASSKWERSVLYTHRRLLLTQTSRVLSACGIDHGIRAAGHKPRLLCDTQLAMTQSEYPAVFKRCTRDIHPARLVLTDELHAQGGGMLPALHDRHCEQGAAIIGVTATPIDLVGNWDKLVVAANTSEGRKCGALVPALTYCPDEPDMRHIKKYKIGEDLTDSENAKAMMRPGVFGRVYGQWKKLNPQQRPTVLFAPDVAGSIYFAEQFHRQGVRAAHIDAKQIWLDGEYMESSDDNREVILQMFRDNDVPILCNRFVLREGIDIREIAHCIFATVFGSLRTYLQAGGRALRAHPDTPQVIIQDHGANYRRHGSLNDDREWELGMEGHKVTGLRQEMMRERPDTEPIRCPKCDAMRLSGPICPKCGYACHKRSRVVVQISGELKPVEGAAYRPHYTKREPDTEEMWRKMYHRACSAKFDGTFNQAMGLFCHENGYYPPKDLPLMPVLASDFFEKCAKVPKERLR